MAAYPVLPPVQTAQPMYNAMQAVPVMPPLPVAGEMAQAYPVAPVQPPPRITPEPFLIYANRVVLKLPIVLTQLDVVNVLQTKRQLIGDSPWAPSIGELKPASTVDRAAAAGYYVFIVSGLEADVAYKFRVKLANPGGESCSEPIVVTTLSLAAGAARDRCTEEGELRAEVMLRSVILKHQHEALAAQREVAGLAAQLAAAESARQRAAAEAADTVGKLNLALQEVQSLKRGARATEALLQQQLHDAQCVHDAQRALRCVACME